MADPVQLALTIGPLVEGRPGRYVTPAVTVVEDAGGSGELGPLGRFGAFGRFDTGLTVPESVAGEVARAVVDAAPVDVETRGALAAARPGTAGPRPRPRPRPGPGPEIRG